MVVINHPFHQGLLSSPLSSFILSFFHSSSMFIDAISLELNLLTRFQSFLLLLLASSPLFMASQGKETSKEESPFFFWNQMTRNPVQIKYSIKNIVLYPKFLPNNHIIQISCIFILLIKHTCIVGELYLTIRLG